MSSKPREEEKLKTELQALKESVEERLQAICNTSAENQQKLEDLIKEQAQSIKTSSERNRRKTNLDQAIILLSTSVTFLFTIVYALSLPKASGSPNTLLANIIPLLIVGFIMPLYVGYFRGAWLIGSSEERFRGWIYFFAGVVLYFAVYFSQVSSISILTRGPANSLFFLLLAIGLILLLLFIVFIVFRMPRILTDVFGGEITLGRDDWRYLLTAAVAIGSFFGLNGIINGTNYALSYATVVILLSLEALMEIKPQLFFTKKEVKPPVPELIADKKKH